MTSLKAIFAGGGVAACLVLIAASCADEGITHISPASSDPTGEKDAGKGSKKKDASVPKDEDDEDDVSTESATGDDDGADDDVVDDDVADDDTGDDDEPAATPDAGGGAKADAGGKADAAAADAGKPAALPPCPSGYTCMDSAKALQMMGLNGKVTDKDGKPVGFACSKGGSEPCDQANPKMSCPALSAPFCAHVEIPPIANLWNCAQPCTP